MLDENPETADTHNSTEQLAELTDLAGVGPTRATKLQEAGYERVDEIAAASLLTLTRSTQLGERTCRCIWAVANEVCESEGTLLANLANGLDVPRSEVATAYGDLAPVGVPPEDAVGSLIKWFKPSPLAEALQEGGYSIKYYHMLGVEGFDTPADVTAASVDALTTAQYVGDSVAVSLREAVEDWTETDETATQGQYLATGESDETPTTDPDDGSAEDSGRCEEPATHIDSDTPAADSTGHPSEEPAAQYAQPDDTARVPKVRAQELLEQSIGPNAKFRPQQWEAIDRLVNDNDRLLLVQRTGWGKSTVYFTATKLRREQGAGPTLIVSPLLSLMHNQVQDAENQLGLSAWTINSNNTDEWDEAKTAVVQDECDVLLISPERLANSQFQQEILLEMNEEFGLLVVDEAHCISDWGHDFRPDYRRIRRILNELPEHIPVAATTATANDRVVDDITTQVPDLDAIRGELVRDSLRIQTIEMDSKAERLAWLAENLASFDGSGIIYCLTTDEVELVAEWLQQFGHDVEPYYGRLDGDRRRELESQLMANDVDALVATNALGMGFNKPDLGWVIHFQRPPNLIRYYQEIGRAGRALDEAKAIMLSGESDDEVAEYFIEQAFPEPEAFQAVLETIETSDTQLHKYELLKHVNVGWGAVDTCLNILRVENAIYKGENGYERTTKDWSYDHERIESVTQHRWDELERIQAFAATDACLTRFIDDELDGSLEEDCGQCANCVGAFVPSAVEKRELIDVAVDHYKGTSTSDISSRYYLPKQDGGRSVIDDDRNMEDGRVLAALNDPGWGARVSEQRDTDQYSAELVSAAVELFDEWSPSPAPAWVTSIPIWDDTGQVAALAEQIAANLELPYIEALEQTGAVQPREKLANSYQKRWNVEDTMAATDGVRAGPVLVVNDLVDSRWTFTEAAFVLRDAGSGPVYPFALAEI
ncbi:RecQ family ATP-dependent DNA helicase [Halobacterium salinarum]|uniref:RecQ family ATP-dependent DNA helicase n=1 Tax=Halobacterium salinarum TaxID=2242 RepID=UPI00255713E9|nr:RecQ family ATP-dependent DNA helicase [Halobacterium salinarum]MDL0125210.1 RecQ family ATP-dependent DNA helicase [Halobacterium salinarum]